VLEVLKSCHKTSSKIYEKKKSIGKSLLADMISNREPVNDIINLMDIYGYSFVETFSLVLELNSENINEVQA